MTSPVLDQLDTQPKGYYGVPPIHEPHWRWLISGYFFLGGISGTSATLAAYLRLFAGPQAEPMARIALWISLGTFLPCPALLILDLGRPARFLNMVRAFRPSSPMSMGTWGFVAFSGVLAIEIVLDLAEILRANSKRRDSVSYRAGRNVTSAIAGIGGLFVGGYTGVLLAATAVPLWSKSPALLASLFLSSATSSSAAANALVHLLFEGVQRPGGPPALPNASGTRIEESLDDFETLASLAKGVALIAWLHSLGSTARPLQRNLLGYVVRDGVAGAGIAAPLVLKAASHSLRPRQRLAVRLLASALSLAGVFALRAAIVEGGRASANDPAATFDLTG